MKPHQTSAKKEEHCATTLHPLHDDRHMNSEKHWRDMDDSARYVHAHAGQQPQENPPVKKHG